MPYALVCPVCKSVLSESDMPPRVGNFKSSYCGKCDKQVKAVLLWFDPKKGIAEPIVRDDGDWKPSDDQPTKQDSEVAEAVVSIIPGADALEVLGNTKWLAGFLLLRFLAFGTTFLFSKGTFSVALDNPYFLALGSSLFLVACHVLVLIADWFGARRSSGSRYLGIMLVFPGALMLAPLLIFEMILLTSSPLFFFLDIAVGLVHLAIAARWIR
jgi:hypothetical protein